MLSSTISLLLLGGLSRVALSGRAPIIPRDGSSPLLPHDQNTSEYCSWWIDLASTTSCSQLLSDNYISLEQFRRWNPNITANCGNLTVGRSYCVEAIGEPAPAPTQFSSSTEPTSFTSSTLATSTSKTVSTPISLSTLVPSTISTPPPTNTASTDIGNGVATPMPTQPGMVTNCNKFHWIAKGVTCSQVISYQKITLDSFVKWNPTVKDDCSGMWAEVNVCVGIIGGTATPKPTSTTPGNGVQTPQPTQPGMVANCNKFHWIAKGVSCAQVTSFQKISLADFVKWNPTVKDDCSGMWAEVNVCVGVIGGSSPTPAPTPTTTAGNGVQTPQPTQPGMVTGCKKFHYVETGVVCSQITSYNRISLADFVKWNTGVGSNCENMWAKAYVCVGV